MAARTPMKYFFALVVPVVLGNLAPPSAAELAKATAESTTATETAGTAPRPATAAPTQIKALNADAEEVICDQEIDPASLDPDTGKPIDTVRYRCRSEKKKLGEDKQAQRGNKELQQLKRELLTESGQVESDQITLPTAIAERVSEQTANLEVLEQVSEAVTEADPTYEAVRKSKLPFKSYLSMRVNSSNTRDSSDFTDGGTRFGVFSVKRLDQENELIGHVEVGVNLLDSLSHLVTPDASGGEDSTLDLRLLYASYGTENAYAVIGKNWSVYHDIAGMTDRLLALGGVASGIYNAGTDGGATGTGRADNALQLRSGEGNFQWGLQAQYKNEIPGLNNNVDYNYGLSSSLQWKLISGFSGGAAYNRAYVDEVTPEMRLRNQNGDSEASIAGVQWEHGNWFFSGTASRSKNHEADVNQQYFDARGYELYGSYIFNPKWHARAAYNDLKPTNNGYRGSLHQQETYFSLQYLLKQKLVDDIIYIEYKFNHGRRADGRSGKDLLLIGIHFNLSY